MSETEHIRPKKRTTSKTVVSTDDLDDLLEETRSKIDSFMGLGKAHMPSRSHSTSISSSSSSLTQKGTQDSSSAYNAGAAMAKMEPAVAAIIEPDDKSKMSGILRKPKYSSSSTIDPKQTTTNMKQQRNVGNSNASDNVIDDSNNDQDEDRSKPKPPPVCVKGLIMERDVSSMKWKNNNNTPIVPPNAMAVEGYTPQTKPHIQRSAARTEITPINTDTNKDKDNPNEKEKDPLILSSMLELLPMTHQTNTNVPQPTELLTQPPNAEIETDLSFTCMTVAEYEETKRYAAATESSQGDPNNSAVNNEILPGQDHDESEDEDEGKKFMGRTNIFDSDNSSGYQTEDSDESELDALDKEFLQNKGDDDDDEEGGEGEGENEAFVEEQPPPEQRAFMQLWTALAQWITPHTVKLLYVYQGTTPLAEKTVAVAASEQQQQERTDWTQQVDRSDVGASRCAGLMSILRMHLARSFDELGLHQRGCNQRMVETRLADLLRTMNYSQPMPKLKTNVWRAMTCIFLSMVVFRIPKNNETKRGSEDVLVIVDDLMTSNISSSLSKSAPSPVHQAALPRSIEAVGMTKGEYQYLTRSALTSLSSV